MVKEGSPFSFGKTFGNKIKSFFREGLTGRTLEEGFDFKGMPLDMILDKLLEIDYILDSQGRKLDAKKCHDGIIEIIKIFQSGGRKIQELIENKCDLLNAFTRRYNLRDSIMSALIKFFDDRDKEVEDRLGSQNDHVRIMFTPPELGDKKQ